jgi:hypothetical protein
LNCVPSKSTATVAPAGTDTGKPGPGLPLMLSRTCPPLGIVKAVEGPRPPVIDTLIAPDALPSDVAG